MTPITLSAIEAKSWKQKSFGIIGKTKHEAMLFKTRFGIHTFGMRIPIDVLVLDKDFQVVKLKPKLMPNQIFIWPTKFDTLLELPEGTIHEEKIIVGSKINLKLE